MGSEAINRVREPGRLCRTRAADQRIAITSNSLCDRGFRRIVQAPETALRESCTCSCDPAASADVGLLQWGTRCATRLCLIVRLRAPGNRLFAVLMDVTAHRIQATHLLAPGKDAEAIAGGGGDGPDS